MDNYLKQTENNTWTCNQCGKVLPSGIVGIANHWSKCGGKGLHEALIREGKKGSLTFEKLKEIMVNEEVLKTVEKLNANLPDNSEFAFSFEANEYWASINFCFMSASFSLWDSENDERDWIGDEKEALYPFVLDIFQNRVIQLMKIGGLTEILKATLSHTYTDLTMLEEGSWQPDSDSIDSSIRVLQELEYIFQFDLNDTRENE